MRSHPWNQSWHKLASAIAVPLLLLVAPVIGGRFAGEATADERPPLSSIYQQAESEVYDNSESAANLRRSPAYNPALRAQRYWLQGSSAARSTAPLPTGAYRPGKAMSYLAAPSPREVDRETAPEATASPPSGDQRPAPASTSLGTTRYMTPYQAQRPGTNYFAGNATAPLGLDLTGSIYSQGGYLSGAPLSNSYYPPSPSPAGRQPFDSVRERSPASSLYRRYWPLMLDRNADGYYQLDAADIYLMTRPY